MRRLELGAARVVVHTVWLMMRLLFLCACALFVCGQDTINATTTSHYSVDTEIAREALAKLTVLLPQTSIVSFERLTGSNDNVFIEVKYATKFSLAKNTQDGKHVVVTVDVGGELKTKAGLQRAVVAATMKNGTLSDVITTELAAAEGNLRVVASPAPSLVPAWLLNAALVPLFMLPVVDAADVWRANIANWTDIVAKKQSFANQTNHDRVLLVRIRAPTALYIELGVTMNSVILNADEFFVASDFATNCTATSHNKTLVGACLSGTCEPWQANGTIGSCKCGDGVETEVTTGDCRDSAIDLGDAAPPPSTASSLPSPSPSPDRDSTPPVFGSATTGPGSAIEATPPMPTTTTTPTTTIRDISTTDDVTISNVIKTLTPPQTGFVGSTGTSGAVTSTRFTQPPTTQLPSTPPPIGTTTGKSAENTSKSSASESTTTVEIGGTDTAPARNPISFVQTVPCQNSPLCSGHGAFVSSTSMCNCHAQWTGSVCNTTQMSVVHRPGNVTMLLFEFPAFEELCVANDVALPLAIQPRILALTKSIARRDLQVTIKSNHTLLPSKNFTVCLSLRDDINLAALAPLQECKGESDVVAAKESSKCIDCAKNNGAILETCDDYDRALSCVRANCGVQSRVEMNLMRQCVARGGCRCSRGRGAKETLIMRLTSPTTSQESRALCSLSDERGMLVCGEQTSFGTFSLELLNENDNLDPTIESDFTLIIGVAAALCACLLLVVLLIIFCSVRSRNNKSTHKLASGTSSPKALENSQRLTQTQRTTTLSSSSEYSQAPPPSKRNAYDKVEWREYDTVPAYDTVSPPSSSGGNGGGSNASSGSAVGRNPSSSFTKTGVVRDASTGYDVPVTGLKPSQAGYDDPAEQRKGATEDAWGDYSRAPAPTGSSFGVPSSTPSSVVVAQRQPPVDIVWTDLKLGKRLGEGAFGEVFEANWRNQRVAVKRLLLPDAERERAAALAAFARECDTMRSLPPHKNVLGLLAIVSEPPALVTEFCAGGSLDVFVRKNQPNRRQLLLMALDAACGLAHLHAHGLVHRDMAARNLLMTGKPRVLKVSDFGLARATSDTASSGTTFAQDGPIKWMSPEAIEGVYSPASDVWAYAVSQWELATASKPFADLSGAQCALAIARGERLPRPTNVSDPMWALLMRCWSQNAADRPTMAQVVSELTKLLTEEARNEIK